MEQANPAQPRGGSFDRFLNRFVSGGLRPYLWLGLLFFACALLQPLTGLLSAREIQIYLALLVGGALAWGGCALCYRRLTYRQAVCLIVLLGLLMRLGYVMYSPAQLRQHDFYDTNGHLSYIMNFVNGGGLPDSNEWQYYHPPLHHFIFSLFVRFFHLLGRTETTALCESLQYISGFYSAAMMVVVWRFLCISGIGRRATLAAMAVFCLHPTFYVMGGSMNNDDFMLLLFFSSLLYLLRWYQNPGWKNSLLLGVCIGCAMMAKTSAALLAPVAVVVFLIKLCQLWRQRGGLRGVLPIVGRLAAFGAVSLPLGLWYPIRNLIAFGQPLGYVAKIGEDAAIYCGRVPLLYRLLPFVSDAWQGQLYCDPFEDYNIAAYLARCSVFGESGYQGVDVQAALLLSANVCLILISLAAMIYVLLRQRGEKTFAVRLIMALTWATQVGSHLIMNLQYPYGCTMDFRYLVPTVLTGAVFLGMAGARLRSKGKLLPYYAINCFIALFCLAGIWMYLFAA